MKKIGILSFCITDNHGTMLQMYALKCMLEKLGDYEVEIIPHAIIEKIDNGFGGELLRQKNAQRLKAFDDFLVDKLGYKGPYISKLTSENAPKCDVYIVGSDTVWCLFQIHNDENFFLDFVEDNIVKIAYAPSLGTNNTSLFKKDIFEKYIDKFDYLSVREKCNVEFIQQFTEKPVHCVLDPTLLLNCNDYALIEEEISEENYILLYLVYDDTENVSYIIQMANRLSLKYNLKVVHFIYNLPPYIYEDRGVSFAFEKTEKFLSYVKNAKLVLTTSYHGLAFSIIYKKAFYYITQQLGRASRPYDLLSKMGMMDRVLKPTLDLNDIDFDIDYLGVDEKLEKERKYSIEYLRTALEMKKDE